MDFGCCSCEIFIDCLAKLLILRGAFEAPSALKRYSRSEGVVFALEQHAAVTELLFMVEKHMEAAHSDALQGGDTWQQKEIDADRQSSEAHMAIRAAGRSRADIDAVVMAHGRDC